MAIAPGPDPTKSKIQTPNGPFGVWILDFGSLDFWFWISDFGFWILDFWFWILDFGFWILDFGFRILDFGFWILGFGFRILDFGFWARIRIRRHRLDPAWDIYQSRRLGSADLCLASETSGLHGGQDGLRLRGSRSPHWGPSYYGGQFVVCVWVLGVFCGGLFFGCVGCFGCPFVFVCFNWLATPFLRW